MPINHDMMHAQTHSLFEKAGEVLEGVAKLKERIAELERDNHAQKIALDDAYRHVAMIPSIRRALWLARAEKAKAESKYWYAIYVFEKKEEPYTIQHNYWRENEERFLRPIIWCEIWRNVEKLCLKKAEEYK